MEQNPYETPVFAHEAAPVAADAPVKVFDLAKARKMVWLPALLMMTAALFSIPVDLTLLIYTVFWEAPKSVTDLNSIEGLTVVVSFVATFVLLALLHLGILIGAYNMFSLRRFHYADMAMAISIVPGISPVFILGMPIAVWGHLVLKDTNIKSAFER